MTKEQLLELIKFQILILRDNKDLQNNHRMKQDWIAKQQLIQSSCDSLNSCDRLWLEDEYRKWHKKEIEPYIGRIKI